MPPPADPKPAVQRRLAELLGQKYEWMATSAKLLKLAKDPKRLEQVVATLQKDFGVSVDRRVVNAARTVADLVTLVGNAVEGEQARTEEAAAPPPLPPLPAIESRDVGRGESAGKAPDVLPPRTASAVTFDSALAYEAQRIHAVAVYCSDGRIGDHMDDFLHNGLGLPRYDRLACPGGPVALSGRLTSYWECHGVDEQLRFMVKAHELAQVILIAHQPCAYYSTRLGVSLADMEKEQRQDLEQATWAVQRLAPGAEVASFMAWIEQGTVRFEKLSATAGIEQRVGRWRGRVRT